MYGQYKLRNTCATMGRHHLGWNSSCSTITDSNQTVMSGFTTSIALYKYLAKLCKKCHIHVLVLVCRSVFQCILHVDYVMLIIVSIFWDYTCTDKYNNCFSYYFGDHLGFKMAVTQIVFYL